MIARERRKGSFFTHVHGRNRTETLPRRSRRSHLGAIARAMTASGARGWRHTAGATTAMIAYDDVDNDRGSAAEGGGGRSPEPAGRNRRRVVSLPGQFLPVRRVVDFFRILGFRDSVRLRPGNVEVVDPRHRPDTWQWPTLAVPV